MSEAAGGFRAHYASLGARLQQSARGALLAGIEVRTLPGSSPPWTATSLDVREGDAITLLSRGRIVWSREAGLWAGPRYHLWARVGGAAPIFNARAATDTRRAPRSGPLELGIYHGEWATPDGKLATPLGAYADLEGAIDVAVLHWRGRAEEGLDALATLDPADPLVRAERERLRAPVEPPAGWRYLWLLGDSHVYAPAAVGGRPAIRVRADDDLGILRKPVDVALAADTALAWRWRVAALPARVREDSPATHDYVSIAAEFDDGRDLTYYWSAALPPGTHYACPLPSWTDRETHWVLRSGDAGLGEWHAESRTLRADYAAAIGAPPRRIVAVWLIAVSAFRHGVAEAEFSDIALVSGDARTQVL